MTGSDLSRYYCGLVWRCMQDCPLQELSNATITQQMLELLGMYRADFALRMGSQRLAGERVDGKKTDLVWLVTLAKMSVGVSRGTYVEMTTRLVSSLGRAHQAIKDARQCPHCTSLAC